MPVCQCDVVGDCGKLLFTEMRPDRPMLYLLPLIHEYILRRIGDCTLCWRLHVPVSLQRSPLRQASLLGALCGGVMIARIVLYAGIWRENRRGFCIASAAGLELGQLDEAWQ